jgi:hypothetical protein
MLVADSLLDGGRAFGEHGRPGVETPACGAPAGRPVGDPALARDGRGGSDEQDVRAVGRLGDRPDGLRITLLGHAIGEHEHTDDATSGGGHGGLLTFGWVRSIRRGGQRTGNRRANLRYGAGRCRARRA